MTADQMLFQVLNALVGRSWALDSLLALSLENPLVKAGPIAACFFYAWFCRSRDREEAEGRRRILLVTLLSLFLIAPTTKALSESRVAPRPFLHAEQSWVLRDGELVEVRRLPVQVLQAGETRDRIAGLAEGRLDRNDLGSFPSDHAAFFGALAFGILLASRAAGMVALAWTVLVVFAGRVAAGMHWPIDIFAGALVGASILLGLQFLVARFGRRLAAPVLAWADRNPGPVSALLFVILAEAAMTMQTLKQLIGLAAAVADRLV